MGLLEDAAADVAEILTDSDGFGVSMELTPPVGASVTVTGFAADIGKMLDSETGLVVAGRNATVALSLAELEAAGIGTPEQVNSMTDKPWRLTFQLPSMSEAATFSVKTTMPDQLGCLVCVLTPYHY